MWHRSNFGILTSDSESTWKMSTGDIWYAMFRWCCNYAIFGHNHQICCRKSCEPDMKKPSSDMWSTCHFASDYTKIIQIEQGHTIHSSWFHTILETRHATGNNDLYNGINISLASWFTMGTIHVRLVHRQWDCYWTSQSVYNGYNICPASPCIMGVIIRLLIALCTIQTSQPTMGTINDWPVGLRPATSQTGWPVGDGGLSCQVASLQWG
jgi:hypothetical protein